MNALPVDDSPRPSSWPSTPSESALRRAAAGSDRPPLDPLSAAVDALAGPASPSTNRRISFRDQRMGKRNSVVEFDEGEESLAEKLRSSRLAKQLGEERMERDALKAAVAAFADSSEDEMSSVDGSFKQHADSSDSFSLGPAGAAGSPHTILSLAQEDVT